MEPLQQLKVATSQKDLRTPPKDATTPLDFTESVDQQLRVLLQGQDSWLKTHLLACSHYARKDCQRLQKESILITVDRMWTENCSGSVCVDSRYSGPGEMQ